MGKVGIQFLILTMDIVLAIEEILSGVSLTPETRNVFIEMYSEKLDNPKNKESRKTKNDFDQNVIDAIKKRDTVSDENMIRRLYRMYEFAISSSDFRRHGEILGNIKCMKLQKTMILSSLRYR